MSASYVMRVLPDLLWGLWISVELAAGAVLIAAGCGVALALALQTPVRALRWAAQSVVDVARYTPILVQLFVLYFALPLVDIYVSAFVCGILAIGLQQGAYVSEILRGGIASVDARQADCARALGLRNREAFFWVVLPQALIKSLPALGNQVILLFKDTTIVASIGLMEILLTAKSLSERSGSTYLLFAIVAILFLIVTSLMGLAVRQLERIRVRQYGS